MRVRVASGVLRGSPSIQENTLPVECGFIQHVGYHTRVGRLARPCIVGAGLAPALPTCTPCSIRQHSPLWSPAVPLKHGDPTLLHGTWTRKD